MPKVRRPRISGPDYQDNDRDDRDERRPAPGPAVRARDIPYSVAWFRDRIATYALGTIICGAAMITCAAWMGGSLGAFGERLNGGFDVIMRSAGLAIDKINVVGLDPLVEQKTREIAGVHVGGNMLMADPYAIKARIEKLDAVSGVKVHRMWPNTITIIADPRQPIALWQGEGGKDWRVIDQKGRTFAQVNPDDFMKLPRIVGDGAAASAATLVTAMQDYPDLAARMDTAYRVGGRRWDVKFKGGADVAMPEDAQLVKALDALNMMQARSRVLDLPVTRIDARHPERFALRPTPGAPEASPPGGA
ncbi:MAG TPA: cell division protein FtsQ/DivIB [Hyphomonadaceae bacterium]|nr:cell division protein FtsQ/DivIB [Hyphomonadaceae bacterium]